MDISKASNFERFIFDIVGRNPERVCELWRELADKKEFMLTSEEWERVKASGFVAARSTHADRLECIREIWDKHGILIDPHTADGINAAGDFLRADVKTVCLETALPAKFGKTIEEAVGFMPPVPSGFEDLLTRPQRVVHMADDVEAVKQFVVDHTKGE